MSEGVLVSKIDSFTRGTEAMVNDHRVEVKRQEHEDVIPGPG
jgi:hypothetical protein